MIPIAIIGAGPYGLSIASHLRHRGIPFRIFGRAMDSWVSHMPKGMLLKSDGFSSNLWDPRREYTLRTFCEERGIQYADVGIPVQLETFTAYGLSFRTRMVPELEEKLVIDLRQSDAGFVLTLEDGEEVIARRVVLAIGITHFAYVPETLAHLPPEFLSHSFKHGDLEPFRGRNVVVIGGGASAIDLAGLLHDTNADVSLISRKPSLQFHDKALVGNSRSLWQRIRRPRSGLGTGISLSFYANAPMWFHYLPERFRLATVRTSLGPSGGWFAKQQVLGRVPLLLGHAPLSADLEGKMVRLRLRGMDGKEAEIVTEHVIAATGYRVDLDRLTFMRSDIRARLKAVERTPVLSSAFESSFPGLYFAGVAAANSFGPGQRFAYGAGFAATRLTRNIEKSLARGKAFISAPLILPSEKRKSVKAKETHLAVGVKGVTGKKSTVSVGNSESAASQSYSAVGGSSDISSTETRMSSGRTPSAGV